MYLNPNSKMKFEFKLFTWKYKYVPGKYRVKKTITNTITKEKKDIYTEFEILK